MSNFGPVSVITTIVALATSFVLFLWASMDKRSHPYSWLAAAWTMFIFLVFVILWALSRDGYQWSDIMFMSTAVPGAILWSLISLFVIGINEIRLYLKNRRKYGRHS